MSDLGEYYEYLDTLNEDQMEIELLLLEQMGIAKRAGHLVEPSYFIM